MWFIDNSILLPVFSNDLMDIHLLDEAFHIHPLHPHHRGWDTIQNTSVNSSSMVFPWIRNQAINIRIHFLMIYYTNVFKACTFWDGKMYFLFKYLRSNDCLIFMTGILIPRKTVFILRRDTDSDVSTTAMNNKQKLLDIDQTRKCRIHV